MRIIESGKNLEQKYDVFADFKEKVVSGRPINYWEISKEKRLSSIDGASLGKLRLEFADMSFAFLVKSDQKVLSTFIGKTKRRNRSNRLNHLYSKYNSK